MAAIKRVVSILNGRKKMQPSRRRERRGRRREDNCEFVAEFGSPFFVFDFLGVCLGALGDSAVALGILFSGQM